MIKLKIFSVFLVISSALYASSAFNNYGNMPDPSAGKPHVEKPWQEIVPENKLAFTPNSNSSFLLAPIHYMTNSTPYTLMQEHEIDKDIRIFASPCEYESGSFLIRSLKDLKNIKATVSDLTSKDGVIKSSDIDLRYTMNLPFKLEQFDHKYEIRHEGLIKPAKIDLAAERTGRFWVTVYIPKNTLEGIYSGKITVVANGETQIMPLKLRVFPIKLMADPKVERGMYLGVHQRNSEYRDKVYQNMIDYGMNTMSLCNFSAFPRWEDNQIKLDFGLFDQEVKRYRKVGFNMPIPVDMRPIQAYLAYLQDAQAKYKKENKPFPANYQIRVGSFDVSPKFTKFEADEYKKIVSQFLAHAKEKNYPPLYFLPQEEACNKGTRMQQLKHFSKLLKECGVKTTAWSNGTWGGIDELQDIDESMDIRFYNFVNPTIGDRTRKSGDYFGIYNHGDRFAYGFFTEKVGAEGVMQWAYSFYNTPNSLLNFEGNYGDSVTLAGDKGPLPRMIWERIREGNDDARYIYTLKTLIADAEKSGSKALKAKAVIAKKEFDSIFKNIPDNTTEFNKMSLSLDPRQLDVWRFKLIQQIVALQGDLKVSSKINEQKKSADESNLILSIKQNKKREIVAKTSPFIVPQLVIPKGNSWDDAVETPFFFLTYKSGWARARAFAATAIGDIKAVVATQKTKAKLYYDNEALNIAFVCDETLMDKIVANATVRDGAVYSDDAVEIFVKPNLSDNTYYQIAANSNNVIMDKKWHMVNGKKEPAKKEWNPDVSVESKTYEKSWDAKFRIPFTSFGLEQAPTAGSIWKLNLAREEQAVPGGEYSSWSLVDKSFHELNRCGLVFFDKIPLAMIDGISCSQEGLGANTLNLKLVNNKEGIFSGKILIKTYGNISCQESYQVKISDKSQNISIPYQIKGAGQYGFDLSIIKDSDEKNIFTCLSRLLNINDSDNKEVFSTVCSYTAPEIFTVKLMQKDISGTALVVDLGLNISPKDIKKYNLICTLTGKNVNLQQPINITSSGSYNIVLNTAKLAVGGYNVKFVLLDKKGEIINRFEDKINIMEGIF